jgi:hypothetical protein
MIGSGRITVVFALTDQIECGMAGVGYRSGVQVESAFFSRDGESSAENPWLRHRACIGAEHICSISRHISCRYE